MNAEKAHMLPHTVQSLGLEAKMMSVAPRKKLEGRHSAVLGVHCLHDSEAKAGADIGLL